MTFYCSCKYYYMKDIKLPHVTNKQTKNTLFTTGCVHQITVS